MNCMKFLKTIYFVRNLYQCGKTVSLRSVTKTVAVGYCLEFRNKEFHLFLLNEIADCFKKDPTYLKKIHGTFAKVKTAWWIRTKI